MRLFTRSWRYFILTFGIALFSLSTYDHRRLNSNEAKDIKSLGVVVSKHIKPAKWASRYTRTNEEHVLGVIYKVDPKLNATPEITKLSEDKHLKKLHGTGKINSSSFWNLIKADVNLSKQAIEDLRHAFLRVGSKRYEQTKLHTEIIVVYRSNAPWKPSSSFSGARLLLPFGVWGGLFFILWGSIGFLRIKETKERK